MFGETVKNVAYGYFACLGPYTTSEKLGYNASSLRTSIIITPTQVDHQLK